MATDDEPLVNRTRDLTQQENEFLTRFWQIIVDTATKVGGQKKNRDLDQDVLIEKGHELVHRSIVRLADRGQLTGAMSTFPSTVTDYECLNRLIQTAYPTEEGERSTKTDFIKRIVQEASRQKEKETRHREHLPYSLSWDSLSMPDRLSAVPDCAEQIVEELKGQLDTTGRKILDLIWQRELDNDLLDIPIKRYLKQNKIKETQWKEVRRVLLEWIVDNVEKATAIPFLGRVAIEESRRRQSDDINNE